MLTTEQGKKIAEYLGIEVQLLGSHWFSTDLEGRIHKFDPVEVNSINHVAFKELVGECKKEDINIAIEEGVILLAALRLNSVFPVFTGEFNNESICHAYIAVMESK